VQEQVVLIMNEYLERLLAYRSTMSLAREMLALGFLTETDYGIVDAKIAEKYQLSLSDICLRNPLIDSDIRGNMSPAKGGDLSGNEHSEN